MWSIKSGSYPDNLVCGWDPLDPLKSDPSDPDNLGHPTHFQPWATPMYVYMCIVIHSYMYTVYACVCI